MRVEIPNEVEEIEDGTYVAILDEAFEYATDELCMKLALVGDADSRILVKFYNKKELGKKPWSSVFRALDTNETDDIVGHQFELEI